MGTKFLTQRQYKATLDELAHADHINDMLKELRDEVTSVKGRQSIKELEKLLRKSVSIFNDDLTRDEKSDMIDDLESFLR